MTGIFISHSKYDMDTVTCFSKAVVVNGIRGRGICVTFGLFHRHDDLVSYLQQVSKAQQTTIQ